ncbi:hypothetical protein AX15_002677 [Amanita polypyramis BW_CC]|nr:hypothetical protein AX15_002677 [Amanita polypyramis BW_CC]
MNNVYVPTQIVLLLRRLANVVSTLSISNHYFLRNRSSFSESESLDFVLRKGPRTLEQAEGSGWDKWEWPRFTNLRGSLQEASLTAEELTLPWLNGKWSWSSVVSYLEAELQFNDSPPPSIEDNGKLERKSPPPPPRKTQDSAFPDAFHILLRHPALYDPLRTPRYPIVLCHGLYGFDTRGPSSFRMHYWANALNILRGKVGAEVIVTSVPGTGSVSSRSESLDRQLQIRARGRGVNFLAHSMGGLDCRYLISHIKPTDYVPLSLTTISTPHRGSPFMDWCAENLGLGKLGSGQVLTNETAGGPDPRKVEASLSLSFILSVFDSPAYANLTSSYLSDIFNPTTPDDPSVKYFSVAGRMSGVSIWHPLCLPKMVLDGYEEKERGRLKSVWEEDVNGVCDWDPSAPPLWGQECEWGNDGLVTVQSAKWGEFLGIMEECDHWQMRGARGIEFGVDLPAIPALNPDWSFRDWSRFTNIWGTEAKKSNVKPSKDSILSSVRSIATEAESTIVPPYRAASTEEKERERERKLARDDAVVKSSTDKLSAVLDWLIEQVPSTPKLGLGLVGGADDAIGRLEKAEEKLRTKRSELETKEDLERFYVALCRKIYDEGL